MFTIRFVPGVQTHGNTFGAEGIPLSCQRSAGYPAASAEEGRATAPQLDRLGLSGQREPLRSSIPFA